MGYNIRLQCQLPVDHFSISPYNIICCNSECKENFSDERVDGDFSYAAALKRAENALFFLLCFFTDRF